MTTVLVVAVVVLAVLVACDIAVTAKLARRFAVLGDRLSEMQPDAAPELVTGQPVPEFQAVTETGEVIDSRTLADGRFVVGFFSAGCRPCHEAQPEFLRRVREGSARGVAVVAGGRDAARDLIEPARPVAPVIVDVDDRPVCQAFGVRAFPTFVVIEDARVGAFGIDPRVLDVVNLGVPSAA